MIETQTQTDRQRDRQSVRFRIMSQSKCCHFKGVREDGEVKGGEREGWGKSNGVRDRQSERKNEKFRKLRERAEGVNERVGCLLEYIHIHTKASLAGLPPFSQGENMIPWFSHTTCGSVML